MRWRVIDAGDIPATEKGALLALLGSMERAEGLIDRIQQERLSVDNAQALVLAAAP
jgi:phosphate:Na+ symporter